MLNKILRKHHKLTSKTTFLRAKITKKFQISWENRRVNATIRRDQF